MRRYREKVLVAVVLALVAFPRAARACGGFFCDRPSVNTTVPIAQSAENVLFVMDTDPATGVPRVEAHIQILYTGTAAAFSWIVPVTAIPTVDVGWDILFDRIEPPTRPSFQLNYVTDGTCQGGPSSDGVGCGSSNSAAATTGAGGGAGGTVTPTVDVIAHGSVGPYDYVIVNAQDGATLQTWLETNGYFVSDDGARIINEYVVTGQYSFVAVKLQMGQDTTAIRPIILRVSAPEACLPLRLTAIAATPDLRINVWVLGDARAVPLGYAEVGINQAKLDWLNGGVNYDKLLGEAANEAQGNAFAVEYAEDGSAGIAWMTVPTNARTQLPGELDPPSYVAALTGMGFQPTGVVLESLRKFIPLPAALMAQGVTESAFYTNLYTYWNIDRSMFGTFDPAGLTADLEANVFTPMDMLRPTFERVPYLTRLATFISPEEMNSDPLFVTNKDLPAVAPQHMAVAHVLCGDQEFSPCTAPIRLQLEDGSNVMLGATSCNQYDRRDLDAMPSSDVGYSRAADGEGNVVLDNRPAIAAALAAHNATVSGPNSGCGCAVRRRPSAAAVVLLAAMGLIALRRRRRR
jgi:MYXO-CTERM domain-containing protein